MCISKATMVYGLSTRSASLVFASDAWTRLANTFPFFDLILLRRRSNTLSSTGGKDAVTRVPEEVWAEVKFWLVQEEVAVSEDKILSPLHMDWSDDEDENWEYNSEGCFVRKRLTWESFPISEWDYEGYSEWPHENISQWSTDRFKAISSMISHFGLALGTQTPTVNDDWYDPDAFALVTAPFQFLKGNSAHPVVNAKCGGDQRPDEHTIVYVSVDLPSDIDQRFTRLIRLFHFELVDSAINVITGRAKESSSIGKEKEKASPDSGVYSKVTKKIEPKWILWTTCESDW
ncbi:hypothetical protein JCM16303_003199 [Sporobolomyces ruberrimus]